MSAKVIRSGNLVTKLATLIVEKAITSFFISMLGIKNQSQSPVSAPLPERIGVARLTESGSR